MKIKKLQIHNWRSIKDVSIDMRDLMILVGQNNHGKSNIFSAILFFFDSIPFLDMDFNEGKEEAFVEITFGELDEQERTRFGQYLNAQNEICIRRQIVNGEKAEYHGYADIPEEDWLKEENVGNYRARGSINPTPLSTLVPAGTLTNVHVRKAQLDYIAANRPSITFTRGLEEGPFGGQKTLHAGTLGEVFYIPAVKNAADDFNPKGKSPFAQLLTSVINEMSTSNPAYLAVKEEIKNLTAALSKKLEDGSENSDRPEQISRLEKLLEAELENWNTTIDIAISPPDIDEALRVGTNVAINDGTKTDISRKGNGLQRSLIFALVKAWAKVSQEEKAKREARGEEMKESKSYYFLFEEPELYLHPQAQRDLFSSLKTLSKIESQVFLSTHSSSFIDLGLYESICVVCKNSLEAGTSCLQCLERLFEDGEETYQFQLTYYINPDRGELFFAKKVILVEGQTEKSVITYIAKSVLKIHKHEYTIIDCGTKNNIHLFIRLMNKFKRPYIAVYDNDHQADRKPEDLVKIDKASAQIESAVDVKYGSTIVLENDIEEEIGLEKTGKRNKPYKALLHVSAKEFVCPDSFKAKIEAIYG